VRVLTGCSAPRNALQHRLCAHELGLLQICMYVTSQNTNRNAEKRHTDTGTGMVTGEGYRNRHRQIDTSTAHALTHYRTETHTGKKKKPHLLGGGETMAPRESAAAAPAPMGTGLLIREYHGRVRIHHDGQRVCRRVNI
jgi:hypothetical protein